MKTILCFTTKLIILEILALGLGSTPANAMIDRFGAGGGCPFCGSGIRGMNDDGAYGELGRLLNPPHPEATTTPPPAVSPPVAQAALAPVPGSATVAAVPPALSTVAPVMKGIPTAEPILGSDGYLRVGFDYLASFPFFVSPLETISKMAPQGTVPSKVQALNGKRVCIRGYMLPTKLENGLVKEFILLRSSMMCCYGVMPAPNEWVIVKMQGKGAASTMDVPLQFFGTLHVGQFSNDILLAGLYQLDGDKVSVN